MNARALVLGLLVIAAALAPIEFEGYPIRWVPNETGFRAELVERPDVRVAWAPLPGSQHAFLADDTFEVCYAGARGPGKSDALLMDFARDVGKGHGTAWKGLLFRRTYGELAELVGKSQRLYPAIFPGCEYHETEHRWRFPGGEELTFGFMSKLKDYRRYHGWERPWVGFDELTSWPSDAYYLRILSTMRTTNPKVPQRVRSNTNPSGPGHDWVKERFGLPLLPDQVVGPIIQEPKQRPRRAICGGFGENVILHAATPDYGEILSTAATSEAEEKAWKENDWDAVAGGFFGGVWRPRVHLVPPVPISEIPERWILDRAYDDGSAKPFAACWFAESNGEPLEWEGREIGTVRGDVILVAEWYGWNGRKANVGLNLPSAEIGEGIARLEAEWGVRDRVRRGPADTSIWNVNPTDQRTSVASEMGTAGVSWERADKGPGSREQGARLLVDMLKAANPDAEGRRTKPGFFVSEACLQFIRTVPPLPRSPSNPNDVDSSAEDHIYDACRYRLRRTPPAEAESEPLLIY